eukprot:TRINITY_DN2444_c0_g1_i3.p1 TRINITY_DN2444_c0_g1~~TRINITY_DN2444_c0_g1_i3.p1  ORF type:complete len:123 (-),score=3.66 TRINITY_DN2444_c0_g1_i3:45-413(-)
MSYSLFEQNQYIPTDVKDLHIQIRNTKPKGRNNKEPSKTTLPSCSICCEMIDVARLVRSCQCSSSPCQGHICNCRGPYMMCSMCLANQLWKNTNESLRKRGTFRTKCAFCRAEFCVEDVVLL